MIRTLHCGKSIENFNLCLDHQVVGFTRRGPQKGDLIYLVVKQGKKTVCAARFELDEITDEKPWSDRDRYISCYSMKNIEFCNPFHLDFLAAVGGTYWNLKYLQGSKAFDSEAVYQINAVFEKNRTSNRADLKWEEKDVEEEIEEIVDEIEAERVIKEVPDAEIRIMGTFQTVSFLNETDRLRGLETLVNKNFFELFTNYQRDRTILIPENRLFMTNGPKRDGYVVQGIRTIPDALLITYDRNARCPLQISLVEYECFGEGKTRATDKSQYLNSQIIPQLMRFASSFSIITDQNTRNENIKDWIGKIIDYTSRDKFLEEQIDTWMKEMKPGINTRAIISFFEKKLEEAFRSNIHVYLIIDELSVDQKETIRNIIRSFKLDNGEAVVFDASIVKLVQKISFVNNDYEYGLTVQ
jgi:hypothetical protein